MGFKYLIDFGVGCMEANKKAVIKTILAIVIFGVLITTVYFAYGYLSDKFGPKPFTLSPTATVDSNKSPSGEDEDNDKIKAPDFVLYNRDGDKVDFADFIGKPIVINFWTTWCPYCLDEMPDFNEVYAEYKDKVHFLMINQTDGVRETKKQAEDFVKKEGFDFPIYFDLDFSASTAYGIRYLPTTVFVDSDGYFYTGYQGPINKQTLSKHLDELLV